MPTKDQLKTALIAVVAVAVANHIAKRVSIVKTVMGN